METKKHIADELRTLSPFIAALEKVNVFTVGPGYFDSISNTVIACLNEEDLIIKNKENNPSVPPGYFDNLADIVLKKVKTHESALEEIKDLSPLLHSVQHKNVFGVPADYFENVPATLLNQVNTTPPGEDLQHLSPLLQSVQKKNVYEVPAGYFDSLARNILQKVRVGDSKVVKMPFRKVFIKYAAAAVITGIIAFGVYSYNNKLADKLTDDGVVLEASIENGRKIDDIQFAEAMQNLSETDIAKYLETNGDITDMATLGNNLEESELPSEEDYLLDEKTLENYLKQIEITTSNN